MLIALSTNFELTACTFASKPNAYALFNQSIQPTAKRNKQEHSHHLPNSLSRSFPRIAAILGIIFVHAVSSLSFLILRGFLGAFFALGRRFMDVRIRVSIFRGWRGRLV